NADLERMAQKNAFLMAVRCKDFRCFHLLSPASTCAMVCKALIIKRLLLFVALRKQGSDY
ncbi:MAG: hypothetical protein K2G80_00955, partial [Bacteroidales bacterium]|nr:hypothetical protein [Bacteroidales bacterium]